MIVLGVALGLATLVAIALGLLLVAARTTISALDGERDRARTDAEKQSSRAFALDGELAQQREARLEAEHRLEAAEAQHRRDLDTQSTLGQAQLQSARREREHLERRIVELNEQLSQRFQAIASEVVRGTGAALLDQHKRELEAQNKLADSALEKRQQAVANLVRPIQDVLAQYSDKLGEIERQRAESFGQLTQRMTDMASANQLLRDETGKLTKALSRPEVRGRYGEIQLRRVAELAGMTGFCDFQEQATATGADGKRKRPDMVVRLPNERVVAVDAKANIAAYVDACQSTDASEQEAHLERFAGHVHEQVKKLADKSYWSDFDGSPDFVVMFVPGDQFLDAALSRRPELLEFAAERNVIIASPSTLIGLLRAVAVGWREHRLAENAQRLLNLGVELHERAAVVLGHASDCGEALRKAVERYNKFASSVQSRLMPTLRKFEEADIRSTRELAEMPEIEVRPQSLPTPAAPGLLDGLERPDPAG